MADMRRWCGICCRHGDHESTACPVREAERRERRAVGVRGDQSVDEPITRLDEEWEDVDGLRIPRLVSAACYNEAVAEVERLREALRGVLVTPEIRARFDRVLERHGMMPLMPRWPADHVKRPEPDHHYADLRTGLVWLREEAEKYVPASVLYERYREMEADLARIPVGTLSKHQTHRWAGRHWKEIEQ